VLRRNQLESGTGLGCTKQALLPPFQDANHPHLAQILISPSPSPRPPEKSPGEGAGNLNFTTPFSVYSVSTTSSDKWVSRCAEWFNRQVWPTKIRPSIPLSRACRGRCKKESAVPGDRQCGKPVHMGDLRYSTPHRTLKEHMSLKYGNKNRNNWQVGGMGVSLSYSSESRLLAAQAAHQSVEQSRSSRWTTSAGNTIYASSTP
jgi:hypothetical protein